MEIRVASILLNRYQILERLGEGGFATVYKAYDQRLDRDVAIKMVRSALIQSENAGRFEREAKLLSQIKHKNIISVLSYHCDDSLPPFIVMEYLEGSTLRALLNSKGQLDCNTIRQLLLQISEGLSYAHRLGLVHRDLSAANIFVLSPSELQAEDSPSSAVSAEQPDLYVKIIDFGLSRLFAGDLNVVKTLTETGMLIGNPHYMSPEAIKGAAQDNRSDIYSLGCILYECLTGKPIVETENAAQLFYFHESSYPTEPNIDKNDPLAEILSAIILRCIQKDPNKRFQSCNELVDALEQRPDTRQLSVWRDLDSWGTKDGDRRGAGQGRAKSSAAVVLISSLLLFVPLSVVFFDQILLGVANLSVQAFGSPEMARSISAFLFQHHKPVQAEEVLNQVASKYIAQKDPKNALYCVLLLAKNSIERGDQKAFLANMRRAVDISKTGRDPKEKIQLISASSSLMDQGRSQLHLAREIFPIQQMAFGELLDNQSFARKALLKSSLDSLLQTVSMNPDGLLLGDPPLLVDQICSYLHKVKPRLDLPDHGILNAIGYTAKVAPADEIRLYECRCRASKFTHEKQSALWTNLAQRKYLLLNDSSNEAVDKAWLVALKDPRVDDGTLRQIRELQADIAIRSRKFKEALEYCDKALEYADNQKQIVFIDARKLVCYFLQNDQVSLRRATAELSLSVMGGSPSSLGMPPEHYPQDFFVGDKGEERFFEFCELGLTLVKTNQFDRARFVLRKLKEIVTYQKSVLSPEDKSQLSLFKFIASPPDIIRMADEIARK